MKKPNRLRKGDKVAIVSLSNGMLGEREFIHKYDLAKKRLEEEYGLVVVAMPNALKGVEYKFIYPSMLMLEFKKALVARVKEKTK